MEKVYARTKGIQPDMVDGFCPGCMHSTLFKLIGEVLEEMDVDVERLRPQGKDWNDDLRAKRGGHG